MNTLAKSTNSRSMRYTCLDVRSPDVNFLRKVMSSSRHDGAAYSRHPCRQSADADIVSAFPPVFQHFSGKYQHPPTNIFDMAPHTPGVLRFGKLSKTSSPAGYKNKQAVSRRRYLARVLSSLMYRYALRQSASVPRFLYPAKGYGII